MTELEVFQQLFNGNPKVRPIWDPAKNKAYTSLEGLTDKHWKAHLDGKQGIGQVPIHDDSTCWFGALDIDNHGAGTDGKDLDHEAFDRLVSQKGLPLVTCRSKSGGIHAYVFFDQPTPAQFVQVTLRSWAVSLGHPKCEVFPKQNKLRPDQAGNWINLPYFDSDHTIRWAIRDGKKLTFKQFLKLGLEFRTNQEAIKAQALAGHEEAPPCVQSMIMNGVKRGQRNDVMFVISVYSRKVGGEDWQDRVRNINNAISDQPLPEDELGTIMSSVARTSYGYKCTTEPCVSLCDRKTCLTREYGIGNSENRQGDIPEFTDLVKYLGNPVTWSVKINGMQVKDIPSPALLDPSAMCVYALESSNVVMGMVKKDQWKALLANLMENMRIEQADESAFNSGKVSIWLEEFCSKCDFDADINSKEYQEYSRNMSRQGVPIIREIEGQKVVAFKLLSFTEYLKRKKYTLPQGARIDSILDELGVERRHNMRMPGYKGTVWFAPVDRFEREHREVVSFKPEL